MKRLLLFTAFVGFVWLSVQFTTWGRNLPTPGDEYTFETSRKGFQPITYPGPLTELDMIRLLLRREGDFHLPLTASFRGWRMANKPDLWELDLPHALKVRLNASGLKVASKPKRLRLGVGEIYNLPVILRNELPKATDIKIIATLGEAGPTDRWIAAAGESGEPKLTYASLNLRGSICASTRALNCPRKGRRPKAGYGRKPVSRWTWSAGERCGSRRRTGTDRRPRGSMFAVPMASLTRRRGEMRSHESRGPTATTSTTAAASTTSDCRKGGRRSRGCGGLSIAPTRGPSMCGPVGRQKRSSIWCAIRTWPPSIGTAAMCTPTSTTTATSS